jgi:hypothetical protein
MTGPASQPTPLPAIDIAEAEKHPIDVRGWSRCSGTMSCMTAST